METEKEYHDIAFDTANKLHRSALHLVRLLRSALPERGLSSARLGVLGRLYREGTAIATDLAAYLHIQPQSLTRVLTELEQRGLITRRPDEVDRRRSLLEITEEGRRLLVEEIREQRVMLARIIAKEFTSAERDMLRIAAGLMDRLAEAAETQLSEKGEKMWAEAPEEG